VNNVEYGVVEATTIEALSEGVTEMMRQGFRPQGGPFVFDGMLNQAMVKAVMEVAN
jgi:hypothetical protein